MARFVEEIIVPPRMVDIIVDGEVSSSFFFVSASNNVVISLQLVYDITYLI